MAATNEKTIVGIIGGMGPMATCDLFQKVIMATNAMKDQEHIHLIIDNNTDIPDRSAYILGHGKNPIPEIQKAIDKLVMDGATYLAMPCNTAHYFYDILRAHAKKLNPDIVFIHMIKETAKACALLNYSRVLLLSTTGTYYTDLYKKHFDDYGIEVIYPDIADQQIVMDAIYAYKSNLPINKTGLHQLLKQGEKLEVSAIILGCTELPLILSSDSSHLPMVDPSDVLAHTLATLK